MPIYCHQMNKPATFASDPICEKVDTFFARHETASENRRALELEYHVFFKNNRVWLFGCKSAINMFSLSQLPVYKMQYAAVACNQILQLLPMH